MDSSLREKRFDDMFSRTLRYVPRHAADLDQWRKDCAEMRDAARDAGTLESVISGN